jgi:uncharacterized membrane protein
LPPPAGREFKLFFPDGKVEPEDYDLSDFFFIIGGASQASDVQIGSPEVL